MLRYLRRLADRDLALDRAMIPLGSCTMKLNASAEMEPITWPEFAQIHPFAPLDQAEGYRAAHRRARALAGGRSPATTPCRLQPNAGTQGELAGLLAIRGYHRANGDTDRDVCLIPSSAHGTNAASAVMAGMRVVVVACDDDGNVDLDDLRAKIDEHGEPLAALMVTYPSTHGVFEEAIGEICAAVHDAGGQVYLDGANLNALVGLARPGRFGADVSHLNLHKTFCIPHGGGGPGVGPGGRRRPPGAVPARTTRWCAEAGPATGPGPDLGGAVGLGRHPAHPVGLHPHDGRRGPARRHPGGHPHRQLRRPPPRRRTTRCSTPAATAWSPTSASSTSGPSPRRPASPSTTSPSGSSTTASTPRPCASRWPAR